MQFLFGKAVTDSYIFYLRAYLLNSVFIMIVEFLRFKVLKQEKLFESLLDNSYIFV